MYIYLRDLYNYPLGTLVSYEGKTLIYVYRDEFGYWFFDGYTINLDEDIFDEEVLENNKEVMLWAFKKENVKMVKDGLMAYLLLLLDEPFVNKDRIKFVTEKIKILEDLNDNSVVG